MKRKHLSFVILLIVILLIVLLTFNINKDINSNSKKDNDQLKTVDDIQINIINKENIDSGYIEYEIVNKGNNSYSYGRSFNLEIKENGKWKAVVPNQNLVFLSDSFSLKPKEIKIEKSGYNMYYGSLKTGLYRIVKLFDLEIADGKYESFKVYGEFNIE